MTDDVRRRLRVLRERFLAKEISEDMYRELKAEILADFDPEERGALGAVRRFGFGLLGFGNLGWGGGWHWVGAM